MKNKTATDLTTKSATTHESIPIVSVDENLSKRFATAQAQLALQGFQLREIHNGYFISKWDQTRFCQTIHDVEIFVGRMRK